nr:AIG1-like protein [Tanacetum cinerariifolium]
WSSSNYQPTGGLEANKVVNDGDGEVKVLKWLQQEIDVEITSDNDARNQASKVETKVLVDGKQDDAKVMGVVDEQNSDEPNVLESNRVIHVCVSGINKGVDKKSNTLFISVLPLFLKHLNDKYTKKKKMEAGIQRRIWNPRIKIFFRRHLGGKVVSNVWGVLCS